MTGFPDRAKPNAGFCVSAGSRRRRGVLLLVTLVIVAVLALVGASFAFWMRADLASVEAVENQLQARLAAEGGIERIKFILRENRFDMDNWYDNPEAFRRVAVFLEGSSDLNLESLADKEAREGVRAWRFSIVNYERDGNDAKIRYGLTDEASKVNINTASREQLLKLFDQFEFEDVTSPELADAIIDWRDEDDTPNSFYGAESDYYFSLNPPYRAKNRYFESVEELLMVKGFNANGQILYGEDYNRNGYLDENEDDGPDGVFPPDDGDGVLDQGILPFVTVYSWDWNSANDNKPRININAVKFALSDTPEGAEGAPPGRDRSDQPPAEGEEEDELAGLRNALQNMGGAGGLPEYIYDEVRPEVIDFIAEAQQRGFRFRSVGELIGLEVFEDGSSNYDRMWRQYYRQRRQGENERKTEFEDEEAREESGRDDREPEDDEREGDREEDEPDPDREDGDDRFDEQDRNPEEEEDRRDIRRRQGVRVNEDSPPLPLEEAEGDEEADDDEDPEAEQRRGTPIISPVTAEDMAVLVDRFTAIDAPAIPGLINVNTASPLVLRTVPGLTEDDVSSIVSKRGQLGAEEKYTTAWLVSRQALEPEKYALVSNALTTRSIQFTIDVVGFADHVGTFKRIEAVVEMRGQIAQLKYYRDISNLGIGYPVRDDERSEGFAFNP